VLITVPAGQDLVINLTNNLSFPITGSTTGAVNNIPTSLVIVGQLGGGLGSVAQRTTTPSPGHENMGTTWPIANGGAVLAPPPQSARVQSFATEVPVGTTATALTWTAPRPGTYLFESGTHPSIQGPMGLYGIVVVTTPPSGATLGTAYPAGANPAVTYGAEVPLLFSEIDPNQNKAVQAAVSSQGFIESAVHGPYGASTLGSLNLVSGGHDYTSAPTVQFVGGGGSGASAHADIDSTPGSPTLGQVTALTIDSAGAGYTSAPAVQFVGGGCVSSTANPCASANTALILTTAAACSGGALACYPPAVNYTPLYYLINGKAFDKTNAVNSLFAAAPTSGVTGGVLVRLVNAGLRMHVPSIVGSLTTPAVFASGTIAAAVPGFSLVAEDGNPLPGVSRVQSEVFLAAGKTYDVMINTPTNATAPALPIYDRELSLSSNSIGRDGGMLAYISINGATLPTTGAFASTATGAQANPDTYNSLISGQTLTISDPAKGVLANDVNVYGAQVIGTVAGLTFNSNGTFSYTGPATTFTYCGNGATSGAACA
jgi:FtsP/CotA-like multicopper oxidase with cupredoxin domain